MEYLRALRDMNVIMVMLVPLVVAACEVFRYACFTRLDLAWQGRGGHMYSYYIDFSLALPLVLPLLAITVTIVATLFWNGILALPVPLNPYATMMAGMLVFFLHAVLLYMALKKIMSFSEMAPMLFALAALETFCFIVGPLRFVFGGTFFFLLSLAFSRTIQFTGWEELPKWLDGDEGRPKKDGVKVRVFLELDGMLMRRGPSLELSPELVAPPNNDPIAALARRLMDRARVSEFVAGMERIERRQDLLAELPEIIARKLDKIHARKVALDQTELPTGEKEAQLRQEIRQLLDQELGPRMLSLLYWNYGVFEDEFRFCVTRKPTNTLKPILTLEEYLGIPLSWYARRPRREKRGRRAA
jgi:hypothetical protein